MRRGRWSCAGVSTPGRPVLSSNLHPAKHLANALPWEPSDTDRLGVRSSWAGHRAMTPPLSSFGLRP